jgi:polyisoprenyl-teichoic acid--peptidoglycan teichoic acid transferase
VHARRIRPDTGPTDRRRLAAAGLSAVLPGLGQAFNRRRRLALWFVIPSLVLVGVALLVLRLQSPTRLAAWAIAPAVLNALLLLNLLVLVWRLASVGQAFLDTGRPGPTGRLGITGIALIALVVTVPHLLVWQYGSLAGDAFRSIFGGQVLSATGRSPSPAPALTERVNVLLLGVDATDERTATLTDTMIVASLDPVGHTVSMASVPRDLVNVPLGTGDVFGPKLNSLMSYAERHPDEFPKGGVRTLQDAIGAMLEIDIQYYARVDFAGFVAMVDAVGGVDVNVKKKVRAPRYDGFGLETTGFVVRKGKHHFSGAEALAFARIRRGAGESDFTRAERQQQILLALRDRVTGSGSILFELPGLIRAVGDTVKTDIPIDRLPEFAAILDEVGGKGSVVRAVIGHPLVDAKQTRYGASQVPNLKKIRAVAARLFSAPGTPPTPWPTPKPTRTPKPTPTP